MRPERVVLDTPSVHDHLGLSRGLVRLFSIRGEPLSGTGLAKDPVGPPLGYAQIGLQMTDASAAEARGLAISFQEFLQYDLVQGQFPNGLLQSGILPLQLLQTPWIFLSRGRAGRYGA